ncbi:MAG: hypothetical protein E7428_04370 [Ruminococcaceae bacterium]|nr:hypothetical protein [Oscillospiraceae bacterium]
MSNIKENPLKVTIVVPNQYSAWPLIGSIRGIPVCIYTVADQHVATETSLYMKTSATNGLTWGEPKEIFTEKTGIKGITGLGYNKDGDMLLWYRNGLWGPGDGGSSVTHQLYKTDGESVTLVSSPDFPLRGGHIGNMFRIPNKGLFAFYNTYGELRSWGVLRSTDEGLTWEQIPIEENIPMGDCPVEMECAYIENNKILALGRKDKEEGTMAMFQIQSSDWGETWTKEYTNIEDSYGNSPSVIYDNKTGRIHLYYFVRFEGELRRRMVSFQDVWDSPQNWSDSEVLVTEPYRGWDTGNVKTVAVKDKHICTYYAGTGTTTGVMGVIVNDG